jgi:hypothetical protein
MQTIRRQLPVVIALIAGLVFWVQYYVPSSFSQLVLEKFNSSWAIVMAGAAFILGVLSSMDHHWSKVGLRKIGYGYSLVALFFFGITVLSGWFPVHPFNWGRIAGFVLLGIAVVLGLYYLMALRTSGGTQSFTTRTSAILLGGISVLYLAVINPLQVRIFTAEIPVKEGGFFYWIFDNIFVPLDATMFSLLAFYIASAAFRAFRARSLEATALLIAGCLVMIGRVPLGEQIVFPLNNLHIAWLPSFNLSDVAGWILNNPNTAAQRGILLGVILSQVAISLRIIFGIERTYMGGGD